MNKASFIGIMVLAILSCTPSGLIAREKLSPEDQEIVEKRWPNAKVTFTGLRYVVTKEGTGEPPKPGSMVSMLYKGYLLNGQVFDSSLDPAKPFQFRVGREIMIDGFEEAASRMKKGEERILIIPYELGYGSRGKPPQIPAKATLVFEVTMVDFNLPPLPK